MTASEMAERLASADESDQAAILAGWEAGESAALANELRKLCYETWLSDPDGTRRIIAALGLIANCATDPTVTAIALWASGIGEILDGRMQAAIDRFDSSESLFADIGETVAAAETAVSRIYALAMLGRYAEAIDCGERARRVFLENGRILAAGKVEHNLGNLHQRRDDYERAEFYLRLARERFDPLNEVRRLIQSDNSLANAIAHRHRFGEAEAIYEQALRKAEQAGLEVTRAEIESNLGHLLLFRGRYDRALYFFERSRRRYAAMRMPHQTAIAEQELADTYLELNLGPEAAAIYDRVESIFSELGLNAERARTLINLARSRIRLGERAAAHRHLQDAKRLFEGESNAVGVATAELVEASLFCAEGEFGRAFSIAESSEAVFARSGLRGRELAARQLRGEAARSLGETELAHGLLAEAAEAAAEIDVPHVGYSCHVSLGLIAKAENRTAAATRHFEAAISIVERMRAPLAAEDFRASFVADKLVPYRELVALLLASGERSKIQDAFLLTERARSRVLLETISQAKRTDPSDEPESDTEVQIRQLSDELKWLYNQQNGSLFDAVADTGKTARIRDGIRRRESEILELERRRNAGSRRASATDPGELDIAALQKALGEDTALVAFAERSGVLTAFVVTDGGLAFEDGLGSVRDVEEILGRFRFRIDRLRSEPTGRSGVPDDTEARIRVHLAELYDILLRPLESKTDFRNLVIVPDGVLHYVPFHALYDGFGYVIESVEISYAPSAAIFLKCLRTDHGPVAGKTLIVGAGDALTPNVRKEVEAISELFGDAETLIGEQATPENVRSRAKDARVLHLACHGHFRPDNPMFSSIQLHDGWLTVRDADSLRLENGLVVLSACETGVNSIFAGNEILGLARGFLTAGASSLVLSLWQVDDRSTAETMTAFYRELTAGASAGSALRTAQLEILATRRHPFFWSPFVLIGAHR